MPVSIGYSTLILVRASRVMCQWFTIIIWSRHAHLLLLFPALWNMMLRPHTRQKIDHKTDEVECEDEGNHPFHHRSHVVNTLIRTGTEDDGETDFDNDEAKFDPEGNAEDTVLTVVDSKALVFCAKENSADNIASDENAEENIVKVRMVICIEDGKEDETDRTDNSSDDGTD